VIKILLVATEQDFRDRLRLALERLEATGEEIQFLEAVQGNDAMAIAEREFPDLVVVEVGANPYGGFGLARDLKAVPELACPVVVILERPQDEWLARWSGADALVSRPVDPFALAQVARQLLEEAEVEAAGQAAGAEGVAS
jgi:CheY-like chemotaxis protein